jgi:hypothetical protein
MEGQERRAGPYREGQESRSRWRGSREKSRSRWREEQVYMEMEGLGE